MPVATVPPANKENNTQNSQRRRTPHRGSLNRGAEPERRGTHTHSRLGSARAATARRVECAPWCAAQIPRSLAAISTHTPTPPALPRAAQVASHRPHRPLFVFACQRRWRPRRARDRTPHHPHHDHPLCTPPRRLSHPPPHFARGAALPRGAAAGAHMATVYATPPPTMRARAATYGAARPAK